uniref:BTB domain-containing protein n=1 Tax=Odontella aurita TaxID=265563 RepID=A0A7S4J6Y1_9STRA|mmetsp:Transcript_40278/g.121312  ORF Transcript_40278/g.121312 Transcript_40278/m.121312 type:complete len:420 (+) Transcript_40278:95-1354(+)
MSGGWGKCSRRDDGRSSGWGRRDPTRRRDEESTSGASSGWGGPQRVSSGRAHEAVMGLEDEDEGHPGEGFQPIVPVIESVSAAAAAAAGSWGDRFSRSRAMAARAREEREAVRLADACGWQGARPRESRGSEGGAPRGVESKGRGGEAEAFPGLSSRSEAVPSTGVLSTMRSLLFSPLCSDIRFVCEDGAVLHAHKCVLAASSEYFSTAFEGPWGSASASALVPAPSGTGRLKDDTGGENNHDGDRRGGGGALIWPTSNSSQIMRAVLSFVYTGNIADCGCGDGKTANEDIDPRALLSVAHECGLAPLLEEAEMMCFRDLTVENWKETLQLAHLYECDALKGLCFDFCRERAVEILTDPGVAALAAANQELWSELREAIKNGGGVAQGGGSSGNADSSSGGKKTDWASLGRKRKRCVCL